MLVLQFSGNTLLASVFSNRDGKRLAAVEQERGCGGLNVQGCHRLGCRQSCTRPASPSSCRKQCSGHVQITKVARHCTEVLFRMLPENGTDVRSEVQAGERAVKVCSQFLLQRALNVKPRQKAPRVLFRRELAQGGAPQQQGVRLEAKAVSQQLLGSQPGGAHTLLSSTIRNPTRTSAWTSSPGQAEAWGQLPPGVPVAGRGPRT